MTSYLTTSEALTSTVRKDALNAAYEVAANPVAYSREVLDEAYSVLTIYKATSPKMKAASLAILLDVERRIEEQVEEELDELADEDEYEAMADAAEAAAAEAAADAATKPEPVSKATAEKMAARIAALLAKAESTDSVEEAQAFTAKAEELMLKYALDHADLEAKGKKEREEIVTIHFAFTGGPNFWRPLGRDGSAAVVGAIGLVGIAISERAKRVWLYGTKGDCESVKALLESVWRQAQAHLKMWRKIDPVYLSTSQGTYDGRRYAYEQSMGFLLGFCVGVGERIRESREAFAEIHKGTELVLASRKADIEQAMGSLKQNNRSKVARGTASGYWAGKKAGRDAELGKSVTS